MNIYENRIKALRKLMSKDKIDAFLILHSDAHFSEYLPKFYEQIAYFTGFSGSNASLIVTHKKAILFSDGRYVLQALKELKGSKIEFIEENAEVNFKQVLSQILDKNQILATDFNTISIKLKNDLNKICKIKHKDYINELFLNRPALPKSEIYEHEVEFIGKSVKEKLSLIREQMRQNKANAHLISSLDDIAYITNLRASDIDFNPVFLAFMLIFEKKVFLFTHEISLKIKQNLEKNKIFVKKYNEIYKSLAKLKNINLMLDSSKTNANLAKFIKNKVKIIDLINPSSSLKIIKNEKEISHIKNAMKQDGIALCEAFCEIERNFKNLNERDIDEILQRKRGANALYIGDSFATIAGFNENGAIVHYRADKNAKSLDDGLLLLDSGAQYKNATTDITRVLLFGDANSEQKRAYTLVLKAHIAMESAVFAANASLASIDCIARAVLWRNFLNYSHGTGHGVGYFLSVHEGDIRLSYSSKSAAKAQVGMLLSIEPGLYFKNKFGIRLENLAVIKMKQKNEFGEFLGFETLTLCPFEARLVDFNALSNFEKKWLKNYHKKVFESLNEHLSESAKAYLNEKCKSFFDCV